MQPSQSDSPEIEVLPGTSELERAFESLTECLSKPVPEWRLRDELVANHPAVELWCDEPEQAIQIAEAVEKGLLKRGPEGGMVQLGSEEVTWVGETRIR